MKKSPLSSLDFQQTPYEGRIAVIYVRVSVDEFRRKKKADAEKELRQSVITQEDRGIDEAKIRNWLYKVFKGDCNESGFAEPTETSRTDLYNIIQLIKAGKVHTIIVRDQKRLTRSSQFAQNFLHDVLLPYGVDVLAWGENINIKTSTGRLVFGLQAEFAQQELSYIRQRSMESKSAMLKDGKLTTRVCYGYSLLDNGDIVPVPDQVKVVKDIYNWYLHNKSMTWICRELNANNIPTHTSGEGHNKLWKIATVRNILQQPKYIGKMYYNSELHSSLFPPILESAYWDKIQGKARERSTVGHRTKNSTHLLVGILKCGCCHDRLNKLGKVYDEAKEGCRVFDNMTYNQTFKDGKIYYYYVCQTQKIYTFKQCANVRINAEMIEAFVRDFLASIAVEKYKVYIDNNARSGDKVEADIAELKTSLIEQKQKKKDVIDRFAKIRKWNEDDVSSAIRSINSQIRTIEQDLREKELELERGTDSKAVKALTQLQKWDKLSMQEKREALKSVVPKMLVYKDKIEMYLTANKNYPLTFKLVQGNHGKREIVVDVSNEFQQFIVEFRAKVPFDLIATDIRPRKTLKDGSRGICDILHSMAKEEVDKRRVLLPHSRV